MNKLIAIIGAPPDLPIDFPIDFPENSGNMVHANVPYELFKNCIHINKFKEIGGKNFHTFVNSNCSHLLITFANSLKLNDSKGEKFSRLQSLLEKISIPIIPIGLGIQSKEADIETAELPQEAINLLNFFAKRCLAIGVRGDYTKQVILKLSEARNVEVLGCPSFFTKPNNILKLNQDTTLDLGTPAASWTNYQNEREIDLLLKTIKSDHFLIEPVNKFNHQFYIKTLNGSGDSNSVPYFLKNKIDIEDLKSHFKTRYRLFRNINDWKAFNKEHVSYTYGTRFHVNMASILSGKPALWITHDARTEELAKIFHLPSLDLNTFHKNYASIHISDILQKHYGSKEFVENYRYRMDIFNSFLVSNGLNIIQ